MPEPSTSPDLTGVWEAMDPEDAERFGRDILDPEARRRWCTALLVGGLPYLWQRVAPVPRGIALQQLELRQGDRVLLLGEAVAPIGWDEEIRARIGDEGELVVIDVRDRVLGLMRNGEIPQWEWTETHDYDDEYFDCVFVGQAVAHAGDWEREGPEMLRIMKPGRQLVLAEMTLGPTTFSLAHADLHLEYWLRKMLEGMQVGFDDLVYWGVDDLKPILGPRLDGITTFEWRGVELLWGRKPERQD